MKIKFINSIRIISSTATNLLGFLIKNKMWWLIPLILMLFIITLAFALTESSAIGPFIYTLF